MSDWLTKPVVTQATEEPKSIDTASEAELLAGLDKLSGLNTNNIKSNEDNEDNNDKEWLKLQAKQARQNLKIKCVQIANKNELSADEIVRQAKILYAFVRT